jgi:putative transposase
MDLVSVKELLELGFMASRRSITRAFGKKGLKPVDTMGQGGANGYLLNEVLRVIPAAIGKRLVSGRESKNRPDPLQRVSLRADGEAPTPVGAICLDQKANARAVAIDEILRAFEEFRGESDLEKAAQAFMSEYRAGQIAISEETRNRIGLRLSRLLKWRAARRKGGLAALAGTRRKRPGLVDKDNRLRDFVTAFIEDQPQLSASQIWKVAQRCLSLPREQKKSVTRFVSRYKRDNRAALAATASPREWNNQYRFAFGRKDAGIFRFGQSVEVDATKADAMCIDGRHAVIGMVDIATRTTRWRVSKTVKSSAQALLLRDWVIEFGPMEELHGDNGKESVSKYFQRVIADLEIAWNPSTPYSPWQKPFIERAIGTMGHGLLPLLPGYTGHNVAEAQKIRDRLSMAQRRGKTDSEIYEVQLTGAQLQAELDHWARDIYGNEPHGGLQGRTPNEVMAELIHARLRGPVSDVRALDLLLAEAPGGNDGLRTVGKKGLSVDGAHFVAVELVGYEGKQVVARYDPGDMGTLVVYSPAGEFICVAKNPDWEGYKREELELMTLQVQNQFRRDRAAETKRIIRKINPRALLRAHLDSHPETTVPNPQTDEWRTPALDAAKEALAAREPAPATSSYDPEAIAEIERREAEAAERAAALRETEVTDDELECLFFATENGGQGELALSDDRKLAEWRAMAEHLSPFVAARKQRKQFGPRFEASEELTMARAALLKLRRRWARAA